MRKNNKILLSGSSGFIGTHLYKRLDNLGYQIFGLDIKESETFDIRKKDYLDDIIFPSFKPDIIIHLAALTNVRESVENPHGHIDTNIKGTLNLLELSKKYKVQKFLVASSSAVYGDQPCPLKEDMNCDNPLSPYALSKIGVELVCKLFSADIPITIFRPFTVYGENGRENQVISKLINAGINRTVFEKYGDGTSTRGYVNVNDLVDGIIVLIDYKPKDNLEIFNLGGSQIICLNDLIDIVKKEFIGLRVKQIGRNPADTYQSYADIGKAKQAFGWEPKRDFEAEVIGLCRRAKVEFNKKVARKKYLRAWNALKK